MKKLILLGSIAVLAACGGGGGSTVAYTPTSTSTVPLTINIQNGVAKTLANVPLSEKVKLVVSNSNPGTFQGFKIMTTVNSQVQSTWTPSVPAVKGYKVDAIFYIKDGIFNRMTKFATGNVDVTETGPNSVTLQANSFNNPLSPSALVFETRPAVQWNYSSSFRANIRLPKNHTPFLPGGYLYVDSIPFTTAKTAALSNYSGVTLNASKLSLSQLVSSTQSLYFQWVFMIDPFYLNTAKDGSQLMWIYSWPNPTPAWGDSPLTRTVLVGSGTIGGITIVPGI